MPKTYDEWLAKWKAKPECFSGVGDGWVPIIDRLAEKLVALGWNPETQLAQVKEKFGTLRFYIDGPLNNNDLANEFVNVAESESAVTCETCGQPGRLRRGAWLHTSCDKHAVPEREDA